MNRVESQARTREQLIATAKQLFLTEGFLATSIDRIADEAGYSKGAVYSNFQSKNELGMAVLDEIRADQFLAVLATLQAADGSDDPFAAFEQWADGAIGDEGWSNLEVEFATQIRVDPAMRAAYGQRADAIRSAIAGALTSFAEVQGIALPIPADVLAVSLLSLGIGLGLQRAIDHTVPVQALTDLLRALTSSAPALALRAATD